MIYPTADDVLESVIETFEREIAPLVVDEYAGSLCLTIGQLLRSVRVRVALEAPALAEDNDDLVGLLVGLRVDVPEALAARIGDVVAPPPPGHPSIEALQMRAVALREVLVDCIAAIDDLDHPQRVRVRAYLERQLRRQQPWLVDAFTGPRR